MHAWDDECWASYFGRLHVAKFLLECGSEVDIRSRNKETSLYMASSIGKLDVVRFLIEQGADIYVTDSSG